MDPSEKKQQLLEEQWQSCRAKAKQCRHVLAWCEHDYDLAKREGEPRKMEKARQRRNQAAEEAHRAFVDEAATRYLLGH